MANQVATNKFTWVIRNFSTIESERIHSDPFILGGFKLRLLASPKGNNQGDFPVLLDVPDSETYPFGWRKYVKCRLTFVNHLSENLSLRLELQKWFDDMHATSGFSSNISLAQLQAHDGGFLVNDEVVITAELEVLDLIVELDVDVIEEIQAMAQPQKKIKVANDRGVVFNDLRTETSSVNEIIDVSRYQVHISQVEIVKRMFEKHPYMAYEVKAKDQHLRTAGVNVILGLIQTLCQPPKNLSNEDMVEADNALAYVKDAGFEVDWLEQKFKEVKDKKSGEIRIQQIEEKVKDYQKSYSSMKAILEKREKELKDLKLKCSFMEAVIQEEKTKVMADIATPLTLEDIL